MLRPTMLRSFSRGFMSSVLKNVSLYFIRALYNYVGSKINGTGKPFFNSYHWVHAVLQRKGCFFSGQNVPNRNSCTMYRCQPFAQPIRPRLPVFTTIAFLGNVQFNWQYFYIQTTYPWGLPEAVQWPTMIEKWKQKKIILSIILLFEVCYKNLRRAKGLTTLRNGSWWFDYFLSQPLIIH